MQNLLQIELNEVNFEFLQAYGRDGKLPTLNRLIDRHGLTETLSEARYEHLEPWIQWVTAHTGKSFEEHGVFRLGDITDRPDLPQIWEELESQGISVGAVSPMNAANRCKNACFFVPDPWTRTAVSGSAAAKRLYDTVAKAVNQNAGAEPLQLSDGIALATGLARYGRMQNYLHYVDVARRSISKSWMRALFLDQLLADLFISETRRTKPQFATVFLNAAAHIQHHYMFNAAPYSGELRNPDWYVTDGEDPVFAVYDAYDRIVNQICRAFPAHRVMIATGLHQDPYPTELYYWRLKDHARFLDGIGLEYSRVEPRMSRDFVVYFDTSEGAASGEAFLKQVVASDGKDLFEIDNRGDSLFVELTYPHGVGPGITYARGNQNFGSLADEVDFVAIKNGGHNGVGYLIDTGLDAADAPKQIELAEIHARNLDHFNLPNSQSLAA